MLTSDERIKSLVHKSLRRLHGYTSISKFNFIIPEILSEKEVLGVYTNRDETNIFFVTDGIFIASTNTFVAYQDITQVNINLDDISKHHVETITLELSDDNILNLDILQPQFIADSGKRTQEVWAVYSVLRVMVNK